MFLHADIDAFFASVEQVKNPRLRGRPVVVGGRPDEAGVIASCSYEARRCGLYAGMALRQAEQLCPQAVFLTGSYPEYRGFSEQVFSFLRDFSPTVEVVSLDEAYVDLRGVEHLHGTAWKAARALRRRVFAAIGLPVSVGIGVTRILARLATACAKPDGIGMLFPGRTHAFLDALPLDRLPGIGRKTLETFQRLNLDRVGELARIPMELLEATLGKRGRTLFDLAHGRDPQAIEPACRPRSISRRSALHRPSADTALLHGYLYYLCERTGLGLREIGARTKSVRVALEYSDHKTRRGSAALTEPSDMDRTLFQAARTLFDRLFDRRVKLRRIAVSAHNLTFAHARQGSLLQDPDQAQRLDRLARAVESIRKRHGFHRIVCGPSIALLGTLPQTKHGFVLRTASLTR